jgi:hypothetical protein
VFAGGSNLFELNPKLLAAAASAYQTKLDVSFGLRGPVLYLTQPAQLFSELAFDSAEKVLCLESLALPLHR